MTIYLRYTSTMTYAPPPPPQKKKLLSVFNLAFLPTERK